MSLFTTGVSTTAMGSNYPQYNHNDGNPHVQNIYHYNNSQNMIWGNDREMMTSDAGGGVYWRRLLLHSILRIILGRWSHVHHHKQLLILSVLIILLLLRNLMVYLMHEKIQVRYRQKHRFLKYC